MSIQQSISFLPSGATVATSNISIVKGFQAMNLVNLSCFWELHWISREKSQISFKKRTTDSISSFHDGYVLARRNQLFTWTIESD